MSEHHVAVSPLTNRIYAGKLTNKRDCWRDGKTDVTGAACAAVAQHVLAAGGEIVVTANGKPAYEIIVRDLSAAQPAMNEN